MRKKRAKRILQKKPRWVNFKTWHQKKESRRREREIERGREIITPLSHRTYVHSPSFLPGLNLILIPEAFLWQTMTDNMRQPQLTRDTERINASDQSGCSHNLLSALDPGERAQHIFPVWPESWSEARKFTCTFRLSCRLSERCYSPALSNTRHFSSISVCDSVGKLFNHSRVKLIFLVHFYSWPSVSKLLGFFVFSSAFKILHCVNI